MHTTAIGTNNVPAFLIKLWKLVEDSKCDDLICWNSTGTTFLIRDQTRFSKELLPLYFKHNNMASFIRQLNMYGFRKVVNVEQGGLRMEKDEIEFQHMYFLKGHEYLLELIKRKASMNKTPEEVKIQPEIVSKIIFDVKSLHGKQENLDTKLSSMKRENETLWREIATLRQQHMKQQQIVNKLIQFLLTLVQPNRSLGVKRKLPLMLNDSSHSDTKLPRVKRTFSLDADKGSDIQLTKSSAGIFSGVKSSGPVIHDITDVVDANAFLKSEKLLSIEESCPSPVADVQPIVDSPVAGTSADGLQFEELSPSVKVEPLITTRASNSESGVPLFDLADHIDSMQVELDALKDILSSSGCTIDTSTLMGLFSGEAISSKGLSDVGEIGKLSGNEIVGTELTQYTPGIFDFQEIDPVSTSSELPSESMDDLLFDYVSTVIDGTEGENAEIPSSPAPLANIIEALPTTDLVLTADPEFLVDPPALLEEEVPVSTQKS